MEKPRASFVTLFYGGEKLGVFAAMVAPGSVRFTDVDAVLTAIPLLQDPDRLRAALRQNMPANAELLCRPRQKQDCGFIRPDVAAVIFDESRLAAELFVNSSLLSVSDVRLPKFLPLPEQKMSAVYNFNGAVSGSESSKPDFALGASALIAHGETRLNLQGAATDQGLALDRAALARDRHGIEQVGGLFRSQAMQLIGDRDIAGISLGTSVQTRIDDRKTEGNAIILYLPRRASVSIYRDGRLFSTRFYEAGNQQIDTSELPEGAYAITLKIQEADGPVREEQRFFAKSAELPPPGEPVWRVQGGFLRKSLSQQNNLPEITGKPMLRGGIVHRIGDNTGFSADAIGINGVLANEMGWFAVYPVHKFRATSLITTERATGLQASWQGQSARWGGAVDLRRIWVRKLSMDPYDPLWQGLKQLSSTISYAANSNLSVGARWSYSWNQQESKSHQTYGPNVNWNIWRDGESSLDFTADAGKADGETVANGFLRLTMRFGAYTYSGGLGAQSGGGDDGAYGNARVYWERDKENRRLQIGAGSTFEGSGQTASASADYRNRFGAARGEVQKNFGQDGNLNYGGNFSFGAAQAEDTLRFGGDNLGQSAIIIAVDGDADLPMKIMVNNAQRGAIKTGEKQTIYLSPYQTYNVRLVTAQSALLDFDQAAQKTTLYPGNVAQLQWTVNKFYVLVGKIADENGAPIEGAVLEHAREQVITGTGGKFQAQLSSVPYLDFKTASGGQCRAVLPKVESINGVRIYPEILTCVSQNDVP